MTISGWAEWEAHVAANPVEGSPEEMRKAFAALAPQPVDGQETTGRRSALHSLRQLG